MSNRLLYLLLLPVMLAPSCGAPTAQELLADAERSFEAGDARTADIQLRNLLEQEPDNVEGRRLLGEVAVDLGDYARAEAQLRRALELGAEPSEVQIPLLRALLGQGRYDDARRQAAAAHEMDGVDRAELLRLEARTFRALGSNGEAEQAYRDALDIAPGSRDLRSELGLFMLTTGRAAEAESVASEILNEDPDFAPALLLRGRVEVVDGRMADAQSTLERVVELEPPGSETYMEALVTLIGVYLARDSIDQAARRADELLAEAPDNPTAIYFKALVEAAQGDTESAESRLESIIAVLPNFTPANILLGSINADAGRFGQAEMHLQAALTSNPEDNRARLLLAQTFLRQAKIEQARNVLVEIFPATRNDGVMFALAGRASLANGDLELAEQYFDRSEQAVLTDASELVNAASILMSAGQFDRAARLIESSELDDVDSEATAAFLLALTRLGGNDMDRAMEAAIDLESRRPDNPWPKLLKGGILLRQGDYAAARDEFNAGLEIDPNYTQLLTGLARSEALLGNFGAARDALTRVLDLDPMHGEAMLMLAEASLRLGDLETAAEWLERAPDTIQRLQLEGSLAFAQGRPADGAARFQEVFDRQPTQETAIQAYQSRVRAGLADAEAPLTSWLDEHPDDGRVRFLLGTDAMRGERYDDAIAQFEAVLELDADNAATLNNLALVYAELGDERAVQFARRAHDVASDNPAIADTLGWLLVEQGDAAEGLGYLEQAAAALPDNPEIRFHLAVALADAGERDRARSELRSLLESGDDFPARREAEQRLAELEE